jgi:hypothetical protein
MIIEQSMQLLRHAGFIDVPGVVQIDIEVPTKIRLALEFSCVACDCPQRGDALMRRKIHVDEALGRKPGFMDDALYSVCRSEDLFGSEGCTRGHDDGYAPQPTSVRTANGRRGSHLASREAVAPSRRGSSVPVRFLQGNDVAFEKQAQYRSPLVGSLRGAVIEKPPRVPAGQDRRCLGPPRPRLIENDA